MDIWLTLTLANGEKLRVNMRHVQGYMPCVEPKEKTKTSLEYGDSAYHVRETVEEIDNAMGNPASPLRVIKGW